MGPDYHWLASATGKKAHLVLGSGADALCGVRVGFNAEVSHNERCKDCLEHFQGWANAITAPPPARVTEYILLTVDRPAGGECVQATLKRKLVSMTSWQWTAKPFEGAVILPESS